jgi:hypothetical protein
VIVQLFVDVHDWIRNVYEITGGMELEFQKPQDTQDRRKRIHSVLSPHSLASTQMTILRSVLKGVMS